MAPSRLERTSSVATSAKMARRGQTPTGEKIAPWPSPRVAIHRAANLSTPSMGRLGGTGGGVCARTNHMEEKWEKRARSSGSRSYIPFAVCADIGPGAGHRHVGRMQAQSVDGPRPWRDTPGTLARPLAQCSLLVWIGHEWVRSTGSRLVRLSACGGRYVRLKPPRFGMLIT